MKHLNFILAGLFFLSGGAYYSRLRTYGYGW